MLREWADQMNDEEAAARWRRFQHFMFLEQMTKVQAEIAAQVDNLVPADFYAAMQHFLRVRDQLFPNLSTDAAWKILVTLATTPEGNGKASVTGIAHGAGVPVTTALRYLAVMETQGLIERIPHPTDARSTRIRLTEDGKQRLRGVAAAWPRFVWMVLFPLALMFAATAAVAAFLGG